jgi:hypothetical protein
MKTVSGPATKIAAVTPHDTNTLTMPCVALYITGAGNIKITAVEGGTETFAVTAGQILPIAASVVFSTGTTATGIIALA